MYCGYSSAAGKLRWGATLTLLLLGIILFALFREEWGDCLSCTRITGTGVLCRPATSDDLMSSSSGDEFRTCEMPKVRGFLAGCILAFIFSIVPLVLCCFAKGPLTPMGQGGNNFAGDGRRFASANQADVSTAAVAAPPRKTDETGYKVWLDALMGK